MSQNLKIQSQKSVEEYLEDLYQQSKVRQLKKYRSTQGFQNLGQLLVHHDNTKEKSSDYKILIARDSNLSARQQKQNYNDSSLKFKSPRINSKIRNANNIQSNILNQQKNEYCFNFKSPKTRIRSKQLDQKANIQTKSTLEYKQQYLTTTTNTFCFGSPRIQSVSGKRWKKAITSNFLNTYNNKDTSDIAHSEVQSSLAQSNLFLQSQLNYQKKLLEQQRTKGHTKYQTNKKLDQVCNILREKNKKLTAIIEQMTKNQNTTKQNQQYLTLIQQNTNLKKENQNLKQSLKQKDHFFNYIQRKINSKNKQIIQLTNKLKQTQLQIQINNKVMNWNKNFYQEQNIDLLINKRKQTVFFNFQSSSNMIEISQCIQNSLKNLKISQNIEKQRQICLEVFRNYQCLIKKISQQFSLFVNKSIQNNKNQIKKKDNEKSDEYHESVLIDLNIKQGSFSEKNSKTYNQSTEVIHINCLALKQQEKSHCQKENLKSQSPIQKIAILNDTRAQALKKAKSCQQIIHIEAYLKKL